MPVVPAPRIMTPAAEEKAEPTFPAPALSEATDLPAVPAAAAATTDENKSVDDGPNEEDAEVARRQTIAARMAKLGGVRAFGGPPPILQPKRSISSDPVDAASPVTANTLGGAPAPIAETTADDDDDDEARRARVRARMAAIGARGMGMFGAPAPSMPVPAPPAAEEPVAETEADAKPTQTTEAPVSAPDEADDQDETPETGLEDDEPAEAEPNLAEDSVDDEDDMLPPPPPPRKPSTLPPPPPPQAQEEDVIDYESARANFPPPAVAVNIPEPDEDAPPPPPRPSRGPLLPVIDTDMSGGQAAYMASPAVGTPASPSRALPSSPSRPTPESPTARRSSTKRISEMFKTRSPSVDLRSPAVGDDYAQQGSPTIPSPARRESAQAPPARRESAQTPTSAGGHTELQTLSRQTGSLVLRNAQTLLTQSKKAYIAVSVVPSAAELAPAPD